MCLMHEVVSAPSDLDRRGERADGVLRVALLTVRLSELQQRTLLALATVRNLIDRGNGRANIAASGDAEAPQAFAEMPPTAEASEFPA